MLKCYKELITFLVFCKKCSEINGVLTVFKVILLLALWVLRTGVRSWSATCKHAPSLWETLLFMLCIHLSTQDIL